MICMYMYMICVYYVYVDLEITCMYIHTQDMYLYDLHDLDYMMFLSLLQTFR